MNFGRTHYDTLKVAPDAPPEVIQAAYRSLARKYHPDRAGATPEAEARMKAINQAYGVLSDPVERARYDASLARQGGTHPPGRSREAAPPAGDGSSPLLSIVLAVVYALVALSLLRAPGLGRVLGVGMLVLGWIFFLRRSR